MAIDIRTLLQARPTRRDRIEARVSAAEADRAGQPVVITIARDFGAEGHEVGKMLASELGIPLYDKEVLVRASQRAGETVDKIAQYDEQLAAEFTAFLPDRVDSRTLADKLFEQMTQVILDLGSTESCIIEGRLSDYILRFNPNHIAVLVTAPLEDRVKIVSDKRGISLAQGRRLVKRMQRFREDFYKRYSAGKWHMDSGKDIVVNRAKLGRQGCVDVIAAAYRAKLRDLGVCEDETARAAEEADAARPLHVAATVE